MDMNSVLSHHLLDHAFKTLFTVGGIEFSLTKHLLIMWIIGGLLLAVFSYAAHGTGRVAQVLRGGIETIVIAFRDQILDPLLGHDSKRLLHYFMTLFFFILACNYAGMIPGSATATGNISVTAGLALCTFGLIIISGVRAQGLVGFIKHFMPVPPGLPMPYISGPVLGGVLFVIEIIGLLVKIFALTVRLFANMIAGHIVILGFMSLIFIAAAASQNVALFAAAPFSMAMVTFVNFIEILVATLQAFIFTLLTAVFVSSVLHAH